ncbi:hypothetical protein [Neptuniibacter sp. QD37_11]|uniref:hypothetical protein n=1 Tax=Neptuniibacter sp. QD37_11 TaxID=3398209 RepID=UPI0039F45E00
MSKFDEFFAQPQCFSDGRWVLSGKIPKAEAATLLSEALMEAGEIDEPLSPEDLETSRARYGFAPEYVEEMQGELCWYTGASGKGSQEVWVYG